MRGSNMNSKYSSRGGSSFRGSSASGSYGYYHDPYYSSSPSRGGRGGSRGRGGSSSYGYYGSPPGYGGRKESGDPQGHPHPSGYSYGRPGSGLTPTSSASGLTPGSAQQHSEQMSAYPASSSSAGSATYERSMESNGESGGYTAHGASSSSGGSNEAGGDDYESARWEQYVGEYSRGKSEGSPRFRGRGRGRGGSGRGTWRGSRGGPYYGRGRGGFEYEGYPTGPASGQFYYGREFAVGGTAGSGDVAANVGEARASPGEGYKYHGHEENGYPKAHPGAAKDESSSVSAGSGAAAGAASAATSAATSAAAVAAAASGKAEVDKHKAEETRLKREHEHKKNMEFREKHWIERIQASGEMRKTLSRHFNELDAVNSKLLDVGTRRAELEIEVNRYNRVLKAEEDRVRLAEEKLEAMNLSF